MTQKQFYHSPEWERARKYYIQSRIAIDGGFCEVCGKELGKIVHHKRWLNDQNVNDPLISLNPDNFRYECQTCHNKEIEDKDHNTKRRNLRYTFDEDGNVVPAS